MVCVVVALPQATARACISSDPVLAAACRCDETCIGAAAPSVDPGFAPPGARDVVRPSHFSRVLVREVVLRSRAVGLSRLGGRCGP